MRIENNLYCVEVDQEAGVIRRVLDKAGEVELLVEPRLSDNFRLLLPLPDMEANYIFGKGQRLSSVEETADALLLRWEGPLRNEQGSFDVDVELAIRLTEHAIHFNITVHNRTELRLAEVWYPLLGGITGVGERKETKLMVPTGGSSGSEGIFRNFGGFVWGTPLPEITVAYPGWMPMPWVDMYNRKADRGIYFACHDTEPRFKAVRFEMHPGTGHARPDTWPRPEEVGDEIPVGVKLNWVAFPYTPPGQTFEGPPVVLQAHQGDWHNAAMIYREWFIRHFSIREPRKNWMRQDPAFQWTISMLPEGNVLWKFKDIPSWAKDALDYGVKTVLISGWDRGGHDSDYPYYEPDPRLGTWEELEEAVSECHRMGMRAFFFVNLQPVDLDTDWYREELHKYLSLDPWGTMGGSAVMGFGMGTVGARMGMTKRAMAYASPSFPEFRQIIVRQMRKLAEIGADGLHIDKLAWGSGSLDFNPNLKTSPDRATWEGIVLGCEEIIEACRAVNPDFCISIEGAWDRMLEYADAVWMWHGPSRNHTPVFKYTFPELLPALAVSQPYDYNVANNAIRYGYQIFMGPGHFAESMAYPPMRGLSAYVRELIRMREELKDTTYLGEFLDSLEVQVEGHEDLSYSTHRNPRTGKRACVIVNFGEEPRDASVSFEGNASGPARIHEPFARPRATKLPASVTIPPERLAIVVEE